MEGPRWRVPIPAAGRGYYLELDKLATNIANTVMPTWENGGSVKSCKQIKWQVNVEFQYWNFHTDGHTAITLPHWVDCLLKCYTHSCIGKSIHWNDCRQIWRSNDDTWSLTCRSHDSSPHESSCDMLWPYMGRIMWCVASMVRDRVISHERYTVLIP